MLSDTGKKIRENEEKVERVKKAAYEILQEQYYVSSKEVSDRSGVNMVSAALMLGHNFYKWNLAQAHDSRLDNPPHLYFRGDVKNLPSFIKVETTQEQLKEMKVRYLESLLPRAKPDHKRVYEVKKVTPELVDKAMENLIKEKGRFNLSDIKTELNDKEKIGKKSISKGINVILEQYDLRIAQGRYKFIDGYAY